MTKDETIVTLGYLSGVHGVRGWVKVHSYTEPREAILDYAPWLVGETRDEIVVEDGRRHGKTVLARLPGVTNPEAARDWVGREIAVRRSQLPATEEGSFYWSDLVGLEVHTPDGQRLGRVERMMETGANDVMVVSGDRERLIPFVTGEFVKDVDLDAGRIEVDWDPEF